MAAKQTAAGEGYAATMSSDDRARHPRGGKQRAVCRRLNNHMGSAMTPARSVCAKVAQALEHYNLYFPTA